MSFVMEAKLFLACNELPDIKGEDTALWRRIRVIDFPSRFVDEPKDQCEFKIDRTLPSRMREDVTWRQTFMKILLDYHFKDVKEPVEVQIKTNQYREENNDFFSWLNENIMYKENEILNVTEIVELFLGRQIGTRKKEINKYKKEIEKFIKEKFKNIKWEWGKVRDSESKLTNGWKHLTICSELDMLNNE
jgi:putative DNA primase/helicase